jgi:HD-GYP domain-containing protein (c-di-GMP phosphodiesterase class II)
MALDLVEGQPEGHALRTAELAIAIGRQIGLTETQLHDLFFASVIKDSGCSNNSVRIQKMFGGDEILVVKGVKTIDWSSPIESLKYSFAQTEVGKGLGSKLRKMAQNIGHPAKVMNEVTMARCTRGSEIARMLNFSNDVADAVKYLDEHWDGKGAPYGREGIDIPILARVLCYAQTLEVFATTFGVGAAFEMAKFRRGKWFDPFIVDASLILENDRAFWAKSGQDQFVERELPGLAMSAYDADIDSICEAFSLIIDAKSSFTATHSSRVTDYAVALGNHFGFDEYRLVTLRRAGLMHDVGKLGVSSSILEKPGKLDDEEFARIKLHPKFSDQILRRIPTFERIADIASAHHERLDGRGYWRGLGADQLDLEMRILTVSDVFDALTAERPYRGPMSPDDALAIMEKDRGTAFDPECLDAIRDWSRRSSHRFATAA